MRCPVLIESAEGSAYLAEMRRRGGVVALLGSGISMWHPSNMPSGQSITDALASLFASRAASDPSMIAEMMAYRALLADANVPEYIVLAYDLGINPEVWRLARAIEKRFSGLDPVLDHGRAHTDSRTITLPAPEELRRIALAAWKACEYTMSMRMLLRMRGEEA